MGHTSYSDADKIARLEFAEACDRISMEMNCNLEILPLFLKFNNDDDEKAGTKQEQNGNKLGLK